MSTVEPDVRYLTATSDLDDYDILAINALSVAVPYKTTESLRKLIWAAMATYVFGNSSVDHVIRRYGHLWSKRTDKSFESDPLLLILRETQEDITRIAERLEVTGSTTKLGHVCAKSALCRLEATFKAAYGLIRRNYIFETEAVVRMLLEQLAWAHEAFQASDSTIRTLNPTKCITPFKVVFKEAGTFYGELSEGAHLDPSIVENYLRFHKDGSKVIRRSRLDSQHSGYYLTALASVYLEVVQELFAPFGESEHEVIDQRLRRNHRQYCKLLGGNADDA
ncbi:MAG: hypothetical protein IV094_09980 [Vitreoscilla sp.]|nr:hypothetical protein [Vitreoscilla sp.]